MAPSVVIPLTLLLFLSQGGLTSLDPSPSSEPAAGPSVVNKVDGSLIYEKWKASFDASSPSTAKATIRFDHILNGKEVTGFESLGLRFRRFDGEVAHIDSVYSADIPLSIIESLAAEPDVVSVEGTEKHVMPLDLSIPEIRADDVWNLSDGLGRSILGRDVVIADLDTGVDVFHPDLWFADGGDYDWIDVNVNGMFDSGIDAVDMNHDMTPDPDEILRFYDSRTYDWWDNIKENNDGIFQLDVDWLYNDRNDNGVRDYGLAQGFDENDPTFGEQIFIVNETIGNGVLDVSDTLTALGTSKVRATYGAGGTRTRDVDLILSTDDVSGHGTGVAGIALGGTPGSRRYVGVAPGAELLAANRYEMSLGDCMLWASTQGADVYLYELSGWLGYFMDGSSNIEMMMDSLAADGAIQVVPAGNLAGAFKHMLTAIPSMINTEIYFNVDPGLTGAFMTILWRNVSNDLVFEIESPSGYAEVLPFNGSSATLPDGHEIFSWRSNSSRGTAKAEIWVNKWDGSEWVVIEPGTWTLRILNMGPQPEVVDGYIADSNYGWVDGATWLSFVSDERTVTWPATADSAIVVGSYSTRQPYGPLSIFSGRGPRIDGKEIVDITAPGDYDVIAMRSKDEPGNTVGAYRDFGGTSGAGPHVAGAAALLLQHSPWLSNESVESLLKEGARADSFTGAVPNHDWGHGKLDVFAALPQTPVPPHPPPDLWAELSGQGLRNVTLNWTLSPDDGGSLDFYEIRVSNAFDSDGLGYQVLATVSRGTGVFAHEEAGVGNGSNFFYRICAVNVTSGSECQVRQAAKFTRPLAVGPNIISVPLMQSNESIERVLQTVAYDNTWAYELQWRWFMKPKEYGRGLWNLNPMAGVWVNVTEDCNLAVAGVVPSQTSVQLYRGWNLVSFPSLNATYTVADLKAETGAARLEGYDPDASPYFLKVLTDADVLQAGYGYWVRVDTPVVWVVRND